MAGFMAGLERINELAEQSPGFVWRHKTDDGNATPIKVRDDDRILFNFAFHPGHAQFYRRRREWFTHEAATYAVPWWVPAGHTPNVEEADERLQELATNGPSPRPFSLRRRYPAPSSA